MRRVDFQVHLGLEGSGLGETVQRIFCDGMADGLPREGYGEPTSHRGLRVMRQTIEDIRGHVETWSTLEPAEDLSGLTGMLRRGVPARAPSAGRWFSQGGTAGTARHLESLLERFEMRMASMPPVAQ